LACWEHYNPLARYALMAQHEEIHCAQFPGSLVGPIFAEQMDVTLRHHALESGCFVINATGWLSEAQIASITPDPSLQKALRGGCNTAIVSPEGVHLAPPLREGEGLLVADLDFSLITKRKRMMDSVGHYARPELLHLYLDNRPAVPLVREALPGNPSDERVSDPPLAVPAIDDRAPVTRIEAV
jgi:aliphatic nitrilase